MSAPSGSITRATGEASPLLRVENLTTSLSTPRGALRAVDGVSFTLDIGQTLGVVGESGSGKSVLGRTVMGLIADGGDARVSGSVRLDGREITGLRPGERRRLWGAEIGMVFQDPLTALNPVKRVGTHLTEGIRRHRALSARAARREALQMLDLVGIPAAARRFDQYPHELSGGMRQRVVIAMALVNQPRLLIADEPTTALDVTVQRQILDLLAQLQAELGMAMILISHNLGVIAGRADRVAVMYAGRFAEIADAASLFRTPRHRYTDALLRAIPRLDEVPHSRLAAIAGAPPNMLRPPGGCRFAPRCPLADEACAAELRRLSADAGHQWACVHPLGASLRRREEAS